MKLARQITTFLLSMTLLLGGISAVAFDDEYYLTHEYNLTHTPVITEVNNKFNYIFLQTDVEKSLLPSVGIRLYRSVNGGEFQERTRQQHAKFIQGSNSIYYCHDNSTKNGNVYRYKIACTYKDKDIIFSEPVTTYFLKGIGYDEAIKNSASGKTMTISWARNSKANGYQIQYSTKKDWDNKITRNVTNNKTTSLKLKNRTPGKQYQVRIRSYKKYQGKTYYSAWSAVIDRYTGGW